MTNIEQAIKTAKLGRTRRDAQEDTCAVFAAALYDILKSRGVPCRMFTAKPDSLLNVWYHSVVKVDEVYYDSMGEFSCEIYRARAKIHHKVSFDIGYRPDKRDSCYEEEFGEMYEFYMAELGKAFRKLDVKAGFEALNSEETSPAFKP